AAQATIDAGTVGACSESNPKPLAMTRLAQSVVVLSRLACGLAVSSMLAACGGASGGRDAAAVDTQDRAPVGKADQTGTCMTADTDFCGGQSQGNCWCDDLCEQFGDCCADKPVACDGEEPEFCADGTVASATVFTDASDGKECAEDALHCLTNDFGACPQFAPLPPDFCSEGEVVTGADSYITSADGMECSIPSVHCVTNDADACPQFVPLPPDFCADGIVMPGDPSFTASADGMECRIPSVHCVTADQNACEGGEPEACEGGELVAETVFTTGETMECEEETLHCVTNDGGACPQFSPLPPHFCEEGSVVQGATSYISSTDGMECAIPSVHCVTDDGGACPQLSPLPPNFCLLGDIVVGESSFIPSSDGMECEMPSVHCVSEC
ncbi:MAG: hypothetical protein AAF721_33675, partial [Myxococcota bacterium]